jgi:hypothetical protein
MFDLPQIPDTAISAGAALGGVLLTGGFGLAFDQRRRKWEDRRRWHEHRRRAYADLLVASRLQFAAVRTVGEYWAEHGPSASWDIGVLGFTSQQVDQWMTRVGESSGEVALIASDPVCKAADDLVVVGHDLVVVLREVVEGPGAPLGELKKRLDHLEERYDAARKVFRAAARAELGVEG